MLRINSTAAQSTTDGPAGYQKAEKVNPPVTASMPTPTATAAICSGVRANGGRWRPDNQQEVMISAPTNFIATPIVRAVTSINSSLTRCSFTPSTNAGPD